MVVAAVGGVRGWSVRVVAGLVAVMPVGAPIGVLALLLTTLIWGTTFPAMKVLSDRELNATQIMVLRYSLASLALLPCWFGLTRSELRWGMRLGVLVFAATWLGISGLSYTSSNRNAFVTGLSVLLVPLLGLLMGRRASPALWGACVLAWLGITLMYFEAQPWNVGDTLTLLGAVVYAVYILVVERAVYAPAASSSSPAPDSRNASPSNTTQAPRALRLATVQISVMALAACAAAVTHGAWHSNLRGVWPSSAQVQESWLILAYLAFIPSIIGISLHAWAQRRVDAFTATVVFGMEPLLAALAAWVWIGESLQAHAWLGVLLLVAALALSQWPVRPTPPASQGETAA